MTARDNRGWTTRIPFADTMYYELGDVTTAVGDVPHAESAVLAFYPHPSTAGAPLHAQWEIPGKVDAELRIFDLLGRLVHAQQLRASYNFV